ncbi:copper resistance protein NlpE [Solitalea sp. MAHUQ-68]|uniref:Type IV secretion system putative lipoprotein virB7 n=1 Tax=Solitalea agri TaxID=2953739 RepID=A0A9X2F146_9SPHI|nr:copper resistance protein NlpE N-terminal domain-containing protein [Solitalea agri]MCO4292200.1 copper resistance protein NlpE [Solitalea agri]
MNKYFFILSTALILAGCQSNQKEKAAEKAADSIAAAADSLDVDSSDATISNTGKTLLATYSGVLPCADCEGIKTELELFQDNTYALKETYLGKGDGKKFISTGNYNTEKGFEIDRDASLYVIDYDKQGNERYFVQFSNKGNELTMLDRERKIIKSNLNYTLHKQ